MAPLVSVVVPAFRHEAYIEECLLSIIGQTYPEIEIVLIDDHSPDRTFDIAARVLESNRRRFQNVVVVRNARNYGAPYSLNKGVSLSRGDLLAFINSDDTFAPRRLEVLVAALRENGAELAFSRVAAIDNRGRYNFGDSLAASIYFSPILAREKFPSISWAFIDRQIAASTGNIVITRRHFDAIGGFDDLKYCHDWDLFLKAIIRAEPIFVDETLYNYRLHESNSFKELSEVAEADSYVCLARYFSSVETQIPLNPLAPCRRNWPLLFDLFLADCAGRWVFSKLYKPYQAYHRIVDDCYEYRALRLSDIMDKAKFTVTLEANEQPLTDIFGVSIVQSALTIRIPFSGQI